MKHCPSCRATIVMMQDPFQICGKCGWSNKKLLDSTPPGKCKQKDKALPEKALELNSPPKGYSIPVSEVRYLTHCTNIANIIAHGQSQTIIDARIKMYLRITEEQEVV